jgi:hypothetical protein
MDASTIAADVGTLEREILIRDDSALHCPTKRISVMCEQGLTSHKYSQLTRCKFLCYIH